MHDDRSVTLRFIYVLRLEFVKRGHGSVTLDTLDEQMTALLNEMPHTAVTTTTRALVRQLTASQASVFRCEEDHLLLTERAISEPLTVTGALQRFEADLRSGQAPTGRTAPAPGSERSAEREEREEPVTSAERSEALNDFFEGFEQEILRARLGEERNQDRG